MLDKITELCLIANLISLFEDHCIKDTHDLYFCLSISASDNCKLKPFVTKEYDQLFKH